MLLLLVVFPLFPVVLQQASEMLVDLPCSSQPPP
jgi:hypothetical protein